MTNYDAIAASYDCRYRFHTYDGVREAIVTALGPTELRAVLEIGCGTGHWLPVLREHARLTAGMDLSANMLARARDAAIGARLVRGRAEQLPWRDTAFARLICVNALHHFTDREAFLAEALRILEPGGALLTVGLDPHTGRDEWWVYDYFPETIAIDRARFAPVRIIRGEMAKAGFSWAESYEAERIETQFAAHDLFPSGIVDRGFTSQLMALSDDDFARGVERIRAAGETAVLVADLRFYATVAWK